MTKFSGFDQQYFLTNRNNLRQKFPNAPIVIAGNGLIQKSRDDDAYPFAQSANFWYLTGLAVPDLTLVIDDKNEYIILPKRDLKMEVFSGKLDIDKLKKISNVKDFEQNQDGWNRLAATLKQSKQVGTIKPDFEYDSKFGIFTNPVARKLCRRMKSYRKNLIIMDLQPRLNSLRAVKSNKEIAALTHAIEQTSKIFAYISKNFSLYKNERDIEAEIIYYAAKHGFRQSFSPIVANGKNACTLHYNQNDQKLDKQKITLIDAGYNSFGFCADITRVIQPQPSQRQIDVHKAVAEIHKYAQSLLKPGVLANNYEQAVARYAGERLIKLGLINELKPAEVFKYFRHRTSHYLGIDTHDVGDYKKPLEKNMVLTVEPGIYIERENIGVRIEDDVQITAGGCKNLSEGLSRDIDSIRIKA